MCKLRQFHDAKSKTDCVYLDYSHGHFLHGACQKNAGGFSFNAGIVTACQIWMAVAAWALALGFYFDQIGFARTERHLANVPILRMADIAGMRYPGKESS